MKDVIVDTNVLVVANRQNAQVAPSCVDACVAFVESALAEHVTLIDRAGDILTEYYRNLKDGWPYELGKRYCMALIQQQHVSTRVRIVDLLKSADGEYVDFPNTPGLATFDRSDRKFAALAKATGTPVTNATDSDWANFLPALTANGINVEFLCGGDLLRWFK